MTLLLLIINTYVITKTSFNTQNICENDKTALMYAVKNGHDGIVKALLNTLLDNPLLDNPLLNKYNLHSLINKRLDLNKMMETGHNDDSTSYTINKGEEIHVCLREKDKNRILHDINTMMFVILHEMAHIMSDSIGHNNEFRSNLIIFVGIIKN